MNKIKKLILIGIFLGIVTIPRLSFAAIALDSENAGAFTNSGTSLTYSHTISGSNTLLLVGVTLTTPAGTDGVTGITFNGTAMTLQGKNQNPSDSRWVYLYSLLSPADGTHDIVVSFSGTDAATSNAVSYNGVSQTGFPDAVVSNTSASDTTYTTTLTTVADNCWLAEVIRSANTGITGAGSGTTLRGTVSSFNKMADSNGARTPAGSQSLAVTSAGTPWNSTMVSFAPYVAPPAGGGDATLFLIME